MNKKLKKVLVKLYGTQILDSINDIHKGIIYIIRIYSLGLSNLPDEYKELKQSIDKINKGGIN